MSSLSTCGEHLAAFTMKSCIIRSTASGLSWGFSVQHLETKLIISLDLHSGSLRRGCLERIRGGVPSTSSMHVIPSDHIFPSQHNAQICVFKGNHKWIRHISRRNLLQRTCRPLAPSRAWYQLFRSLHLRKKFFLYLIQSQLIWQFLRQKGGYWPLWCLCE